LCLLPLVNNGFSLSSFFLSLLSFLWIGAQFPQEKFLSYGRIFTLHYYFLLMCILFSSFYWLSTGFSWIYWNFIIVSIAGSSCFSLYFLCPNAFLKVCYLYPSFGHLFIHYLLQL
jgi:hypothetical protein